MRNDEIVVASYGWSVSRGRGRGGLVLECMKALVGFDPLIFGEVEMERLMMS